MKDYFNSSDGKLMRLSEYTPKDLKALQKLAEQQVMGNKVIEDSQGLVPGSLTDAQADGRTDGEPVRAKVKKVDAENPPAPQQRQAPAWYPNQEKDKLLARIGRATSVKK